MTKRQKLEKNKRKRRFFSILMILVTGLILSASTYAWFTANKDVDVESIDVNVSASTGLQISAYPDSDESWKTYVSSSEFKAQTFNQFPNSMSPVSTVGAVSTANDSTKGKMIMYKGTLDSSLDSSNKDVYSLTAAVSNENTGTSGASTGGDFIAFDLFVRAGTEGTVYLKKPSSITLNNDPSNADAGSGIQNATRVAFVMEGYNSSTSTKQSAATGLNCTTANDYAADGSTLDTSATAASRCFAHTIWEPNADQHEGSGKISALNTSTFGYTSTDLYESDGTTYKPLTYYGVKSAITTKFPIASTSGMPKASGADAYFAEVNTTTTSTEIDDTNRVAAFKVRVGVNKIRVYVWIEGQDVDCEDKASNSTVNVDLAFSLDSSV